MVTAHMKEAGVKELFSYERGSGRADDVVAAIYEAMEVARTLYGRAMRGIDEQAKIALAIVRRISATDGRLGVKQ
jgi:hypothetical protein